MRANITVSLRNSGGPTGATVYWADVTVLTACPIRRDRDRHLLRCYRPTKGRVGPLDGHQSILGGVIESDSSDPERNGSEVLTGVLRRS